MAFVPMSGGGDAKAVSGTLNRGSSAVTVECGFRPSKIICIHGSGSSTTSANGETQFIYDSDWSSSLVICNYRNGSGTAYMAKYAVSNYITLSDTGFILNGTSSSQYQGTYSYTAIG